MSKKNNRNTTAILVEMIVLTVIVVMIQLLGCKMIGTLSTVFCVIPIMFGSVISGNLGGAWLGFVYGVSALFQPEFDEFISVNVSAGLCTSLIIGTIAGVVTSIVYNYLAKKKSKTIATFAGALTWPIVKNLLGLLFFVVFFRPIFARHGFFVDGKISYFTKNVMLQAVFEIIVGMIASPIIVKLAELNEEKIIKKHNKIHGDTNENNSL